MIRNILACLLLCGGFLAYFWWQAGAHPEASAPDLEDGRLDPILERRDEPPVPEETLQPRGTDSEQVSHENEMFDTLSEEQNQYIDVDGPARSLHAQDRRELGELVDPDADWGAASSEPKKVGEFINVEATKALELSAEEGHNRKYGELIPPDASTVDGIRRSSTGEVRNIGTPYLNPDGD